MGLRPVDRRIRIEDIKRDADTESLLFKAARLLNKPNSAFFGALSESIAGRDPFRAVGQAFKGEREFGGEDLLKEAFDIDPKSKLGRRAGLVLDVVNPFDPLLLLGLGGLTKVGKAARLAKGIPGAPQLAKTFGAQAKAGQRGLLNLGGRRVPIPGDAAVLDALQRGGGVLRDTGVGRGVRQLFGGKKGFLETQLPAGFTEEQLELFQRATDLSGRNANIFGAETSRYIDSVRSNVKRTEMPDFLEVIDQTGKATGVLEQDITRFVGTGSGASRRQQAVEDTMSFFKGRNQAAQEFLGGAGASRFTRPEIGFVSRIFHPKKGVTESELRRFFGPKDAKTGRVIELEGRSDNVMNRSLVVDADQPVARETLTDAGKREFDQLGPARLEQQRLTDPDAHVDFLKRNRLSVKEYDELVRKFELGTVEGNPVAILAAMQDEMANALRTNDLIGNLEDAGIAVKWSSVPKDDLGKFIKIDQGQWANKNLAIPAIYGDAFQKYQEVFFPGPEKPLFSTFLSTVFGDTLGNLGLLSWWKGFAITGFGPTAFWNRNFITGVMKNYYEGLGPTSPKGFEQAARFYKEGLVTVAHSLGIGGEARFGKRLDLSGEFAGGDIVFRLGDGVTVPVSRTRIMQDYMAFGMHGGGSPHPEIIEGMENASTALRQAAFSHFHRGNFRVEMGMRIPLMLKFMEDTLEVARKAGVQLPKRIGPRSETPERIGDLWDVATTNAREGVLRAHFDYNDLTPFERRLRASYIPFYVWARKNIPNETINMMQQPGRYVPFAKAYYNAFSQQGITPEDLPEWAQRGFAVPISPTEDSRARWLDFTGFLPFLDIAELGEAVGTGIGLIEPQTGKTRQSELIRYIATRYNPFVTQIAEQGLQRNFFTGRSFSGDVPEDILGLTVGADVANLANLFRPARDIDRLNPFNAFGPTPRPGRNEPAGPERLTRLLTGVKVRATDKGEASLSLKRRRNRIKRFKSQERKARREGNAERAEFFRLRAESLEEGVK